MNFFYGLSICVVDKESFSLKDILRIMKRILNELDQGLVIDYDWNFKLFYFQNDGRFKICVLTKLWIFKNSAKKI